MVDKYGNHVVSDTRIVAWPFTSWTIAGATLYEHFDIPHYELEVEDGTRYLLTRQPENGGLKTYAYNDPQKGATTVEPRSGKLKVTKITSPSGEVIKVVNDPENEHIDFIPAGQTTASRSLFVERDEKGRIKAIRDPLSGPSGMASVKYEYNEDTGNLFKVHKLVDRAGAGTYATTTYRCENAAFPHYITTVDDPRGVQAARTTYYDATVNSLDAPNNGRIKSIVDAKGRETTFEYPAIVAGMDDPRARSKVVVRDHEGNETTQQIDGFGNDIVTKNALGFVTKRKFEASEPTLLTQEEFSTKLAPTDSTGTILKREMKYEDPNYPFAPSTVTGLFPGAPEESAKPRTMIEYNTFGQTTKTTEPSSVASGGAWFRVYSYDGHGQLLTETFTGTDPSATAVELAENRYLPSGQLEYARDAMGTFTVYSYYGAAEALGKIGDLKSVEVREESLSGPTLSKVVYEYDPQKGSLGSVTKQKVLRFVNTLETWDETSYNYDPQGRVTKTTDAMLGTSETQYNLLGKIAASTDRYNATTRYYYDRTGDQTCVRYADGNVALTATFYDTAARERHVIVSDRHARTAASQATAATRTIYDRAGRPRRVEKLIATLSIREEIRLKINAGTDPELVCDTTKELTPETVLSFTTTQYYEDGRVAETRDANDRKTTYEYSANGFKRVVRPPNYIVGSDTFTTEVIETNDLSGNVIFSQTLTSKNAVPEAHRPVMRHSYDQLNRRRFTQVFADENATAPDATMEETQYDWSGRVIRRIDAGGVKTRFDHDGLGRLKQVVEVETITAEEATTSYTYDEVGNLLSQTDAKNRTTQFAYDALGRRTRRTLPDPALYEIWTHDYSDGAGAPPAGKKWNKVEFDDLARRKVVTVYDALGRTDQRKAGSQVLADYDYWPAGRVWKVKDPFTASINASSFVEFHYDEAGRLQWKRQPLDAANTAVLTYGYYADGALKSIDTDKGTRVTYAYDSRGRLWKVNPEGTDPGAATAATPADATYGYDPVGNQLSVKYRNGVETTNTFNARNQLRRMRSTRGTGANPPQWANFDYDGAGELAVPGADAAWGASVLAKSGQRNRLKENVNGALRQVDYSYDQRRRLTLETIGASSINYAGNIGSGGSLSGYDAVGNRRSRIVESVAGVQGTPSNVHFDKADRIDNDAVETTRSTRFDLAGNVTVPDLNGDGTIDGTESGHAYTYNFDNQLLTAAGGGKTVTLSYDAAGNRIKKVVTGTGAGTTYYLVEDRNPTGHAQVLEERSTPASSPSVVYVHGLDLVRQARGSQVRYFGYDGLGSVRYLTDGTSGGVTDTYTYDAFGIQLSPPGSTVNNYRFAGEQWDSDLNLYYLRARYYHPHTGRFWTSDTFEGSQNDPLSLHKYLYAHADPVNNVDPTGMFTEGLSGLYYGMSARLFIAAPTIAKIGFYATAGAATFYLATSAAIAVDDAYFGGGHTDSLYVLRDASAKVFFIAYLAGEGGGSIALVPSRSGGTPPVPKKTIELPKSRYPHSYQHVVDSQNSGRPALVQAQRSGTVQRRADALRNMPTQPGMDRDEYPPAVTAQGGEGSSVRHIPPGDNRGSGAYIGNQLRDVKDGEWVIIKPVDDTGGR